jgi:hypothetical protein
MASFEFTDRDYSERKILLEIDHEFNIFSIAIYEFGGKDYTSGIIPLDDLREKGLFIKETVRVKEAN